MIEFAGVHRSYHIPVIEPGLKGMFRHLFSPSAKIKKAVEGVNFAIKPGEAVGYVGTNGAGKSTTIKLMLGILQPDSGDIKVMGQRPAPLSDDIKRRIGVVFGQRSQLWWNLPVQDSLELFAKIYHVPADRTRQSINELAERLDIGRLLTQTARQLSLGERMRCELAMACLHNPGLLVLDEPTIGLDVASRFRLREFLKERNRTSGTTIFLTTHDLGDIQEVCGRIILIDHGKLLADDSMPALCRRLGNEPCLQFVFAESFTPEKILSMEDLLSRIYSGLWTLETTGDFSATIRFPGGQVVNIDRVQRAFLDQFHISTCTFSESLPLESILRQLGTPAHLKHKTTAPTTKGATADTLTEGVPAMGGQYPKRATEGALTEGDPGEGGELSLIPAPAGHHSSLGISGTALLRKARHLRRRFPTDAAIHLLELAERANSESERLAVLLLLRGLESAPNRRQVLPKLLEFARQWNEPSLQATLVRLVALFGSVSATDGQYPECTKDGALTEGVNDPGVRDFITRKLADKDARARANAVEAWGIIGCLTDSPEILSLTKDESPRVLANVAILRLNDSGFQGIEEMRTLLQDPTTSEAGAYALRMFFESRPLERWFSRTGGKHAETMAFLAELFTLEDLLAQSVKQGGKIRQRCLALASFPYSRGLAALFDAGKTFSEGFPKEEIERLTGVKF